MTQKSDSVQSKEGNQQNAPSQTRRVHDTMASEEIRDVFDQEPQSFTNAPIKKGNTSFFQQGMADAFAEEETIQSYEEPPLLLKIRSFFADFDFSDRSDKTKGFTIVSTIHAEINSCRVLLEEMSLSMQKHQIPRQLREDLYELASFQEQTFSYMEETRPTF